MENKLWIFGDSFSVPFELCKDPWGKEYIDWKGYSPKYFGDLLGDKLGMVSESLAMGGASNSDIFEKICLNVGKYNIGDVIVVGWSDTGRFRMEIDNKWVGFVPEMIAVKHPAYQYVLQSQQTLEETMINRTHPLYWKEVIAWSDLLKTLLNKIGIRIIFWSPFYMWKNYKHKDSAILDIIPSNWFIGFDINSIHKESNGVVSDGHFSEKGHIQLADVLYSKLNPKII
jgi:hypothetical protein